MDTSPSPSASGSENINVSVRVRPLNKTELESKAKNVWSIDSNTHISHADSEHSFCFDHVFDEQSTNEQIYEHQIRPVIESVVQGFNAAVFAYGQTSSGKTFTMMGAGPENMGIIPLSIRHIFKSIQNMPSREFLLRLSCLEIYNEVITDLLQEGNSNLKVKVLPTGEVHVNKLTEKIVVSPDQILGFFKTASERRHVAETDMNEYSSRSHTVFRLVVESREHGNVGAVSVATLYLIDLAGSERAGHTNAGKARLKEGSHINRSLLTLGSVMRKLASSDPSHVPYRDSKLTHILQPALGGNSRTAIVCTVTPAQAYQDITASTLKFASNAKVIENKIKKNEIVDDQTLIKRLKSEIEGLKKKLSTTDDNPQDAEVSKKLNYLMNCFVKAEIPASKISKPRRRKTVHVTSFQTNIHKLDVESENSSSKQRRSLDSDDLGSPVESTAFQMELFRQARKERADAIELTEVLEARCEELETTAADLQALVQTKDCEIGELKSSVEAFKASSDSKDHDKNMLLNVEIAKAYKLEHECSVLRDRLDNEVGQIHQQLEITQAQLDSALLVVKEKNAEIDSLRKSCADKDELLETSKESGPLAASQEHVLQLEIKLEKAEDSLKELGAQLKIRTSKLQSVSEEYRKFKENQKITIREHVTRLEQLSDLVNENEAEKEQALADLEALEDLHNDELDRYSALQADYSALEDTIAELQGQVESFELTAAEQEDQHLSTTEAFAQEIQALKKDLQSQVLEVEKARQLLAKANSDLLGNEQLYCNEMQDLRVKSELCDKLSLENNKLKLSLDELQGKLDVETGKLSSLYEEVNLSLSEYKAQEKDLKALLTKKEQVILDMQQNMNQSQRDSLVRLNTQVKEAEDRVRLEAQLKFMEDIDLLKTENQTLKGSKAHSQAIISDLEERISRLNAALSDNEIQTSKRAGEQVSALQDQLNEATKTLGNEKERNDSLRKECGDLKRKIEKLQRDHSARIDSVRSQLEQAEHLSGVNDCLEKRLLKLTRKEADMDARVAAAEDMRSKAAGHAEFLEHENQELKAIVGEKNDTIRNREKRWHEKEEQLSNEISGLKKEVTRLTVSKMAPSSAPDENQEPKNMFSSKQEKYILKVISDYKSKYNAKQTAKYNNDLAQMQSKYENLLKEARSSRSSPSTH